MASKGRPKGRKNHQVDVVTAEKTRCKKCGSTARTRYKNRRELAISGADSDGNRYDCVVWRRCQCENCGQWRDDVSREAKR